MDKLIALLDTTAVKGLIGGGLTITAAALFPADVHYILGGGTFVTVIVILWA